MNQHTFSVLLSIHLGVKLLGYMVTLCFNFWELSNCFPKWMNHFTFSLEVHEGSSFCTYWLTLQPILMHNYQVNSILYWDFLGFCLIFLYVSWSQPGYHITFDCHFSSGSSWLWQFLKFPLFLVTSTVWGIMISYIIRCSFVGIQSLMNIYFLLWVIIQHYFIFCSD